MLSLASTAPSAGYLSIFWWPCQWEWSPEPLDIFNFEVCTLGYTYMTFLAHSPWET